MRSEDDMNHSWSVDPSNFMKTVEKDVKRRVVDVANQVFEGVVARSPVLSGAFRSVWTLSEGSPNFVQNMDKLTGVIPAPKLPAIRPTAKFPVLYVANGQPYGWLLENGSSKKAPLGMVSVTIANIR